MLLGMFFPGNQALSQGSGKALDFDGSNDWVDCSGGSGSKVSAASLGLPTRDITVEAWVFPRTFQTWDAVVGFLQDNGTFERGWDIELRNGGRFAFTLESVAGGGLTYMESSSTFSTNEWYHIAGTYDGTTMKLYVNGILEASSTAESGDINYDDSWLAVGMYKDDNEENATDAVIDEVRIWNVAKTETQIRAAMCHKLTGSETGLVSYYKMDSATGSTMYDYAGSNDGALTNMTVPGDWVTSGAAIGDTSMYVYPTATLTMPSALHGSLEINTIGGSPDGIHVYRVDELPNSLTGVSIPADNYTSFGVFAANGATPSYTAVYHYGAYPTAVTDESSIILYSRDGNDDATWANTGAVLNTGAKTLTRTGMPSIQEFFLGNFPTATCNAPSALGASGITAFTADLDWTTGGSGMWNIEYGPTGFTPGTGTKVLGITANPYNLPGLTPSTSYDYYVQDSCPGLGSSFWTGPMNFTTLASTAHVGAGIALDFDGVDDWVDCSGGGGAKVSASSLSLPTTAITVEAWVKPGVYNTWDAIVSFLQDNGSFERGWDLELRSGNKFGFTLKSTGTSALTYMETGKSFEVDEWYHIAGTYDGTTMKLYVNGILEASSTSQSGDIDYDDSWLAIGMYKDDNEALATDAQIDEVRIWDMARSESQIREYMCQKLTGSESGLVSYFQLNDGTGTTATDMGPAGNNGTLTSMDPGSDWVWSGAALGDTSVYEYASSWGSVSLALTASGFGTFTMDNIDAYPNGVHLYQVNSTPNSTSGIVDPGSTGAYFGTFIVGNRPNLYSITYDYSGYSTAVANEANLSLYNRGDNSILDWTNAGSKLQTSLDILTNDSVGSRREFIIADFSPVTCPAPTELSAYNLTLSDADLKWVTGGASTWNLEWGDYGFAPGTGTMVAGLSLPVHNLTGLGASVSYDFYVQDDCGGSTESVWSGPFTFTTVNPCPDPIGLFADNITSSTADINWTAGGAPSGWNIQWGFAGFTLGTGIVTPTTSNPHTLGPMSASTTFDVYVQSDCDSLESNWIGPITFTTDSVGTGVDQLADQSVNVYPNPASQSLHVEVAGEFDYKVVIYSMMGRKMVATRNTVVDLAGFSDGIYLLTLTDESGRRIYSRKITVLK